MSALFLLQNYKPCAPPPSLIINSTSVFSRQTLKERSGILTHKGQFNLRIHSSGLFFVRVCECLKTAQMKLSSKMKQQETGANYQAGDKKDGRERRHSRTQSGRRGADAGKRRGARRPPRLTAAGLDEAPRPHSKEGGFHETPHAVSDKNARISPKTQSIMIQLR